MYDFLSEESYSKGIVLFRDGDKAEALYILIEGAVHLEIKNGGSITYRMNEPGEIFMQALKSSDDWELYFPFDFQVLIVTCYLPEELIPARQYGCMKMSL